MESRKVDVAVIGAGSAGLNARRAVEKAGGTATKPIFDFPGGKRFHFLDPNGNELAVWSE